MPKPYLTHRLKVVTGKGDTKYVIDDVTHENKHMWRSNLIFFLNEFLMCFDFHEPPIAFQLELYKSQVRDSYPLTCNSWTSAGRFQFDGKPIDLFGFGRIAILEVFKEHGIRKAYVKIYYEY